jgi:putative membrane protein
VLATLPARRAAVVTALLRRRTMHVLTHPITAGLITTAGLYVLYLTPLYAASGHNTAVHHGIHVHFLFAGSLFTWSVAGPDPAPRRPGLRIRIAVLITAAGAHAFLAKLLYAHAEVLPPGAEHHPDHVRQAAELVYYGGDVAELVIAAALFSTWLRHRARARSAADVPL